jgi:hypothetical protein
MWIYTGIIHFMVLCIDLWFWVAGAIEGNNFLGMDSFDRDWQCPSISLMQNVGVELQHFLAGNEYLST